MYSSISPQDWGLSTASPQTPPPRAAADFERRFGHSIEFVASRCAHVLEEWLPRHFDQESGSFYGFYDPVHRCLEPPQLVNLIAPWLALAGYDRTGNANLLEMACRAAEWLHASGMVIHHPMSMAMGGVLEPDASEAWTKYAAEYVILNLGLHARTDENQFLERALQSGRFLIQAARHRFAVKYVVSGRLRESWDHHGWQAFGRAIEALLCLHEETGDEMWREYAFRFGEYALSIQKPDGGFYLINGEYYNTDLAADPIRGLTFLYEESSDRRFLHSATRFADWHLDRQLGDGSWPMTIDTDGNVVCPTVGPGDVPNIAIALLRLHRATGDDRYLESALRACAYSLSVQITPESDYQYRDDTAVLWGFWSWIPFYDYTVSADQATHHVRGLFFVMDCLRAVAADGPKA